MVIEKVNINGEFLGISSLAVYSAPWYLQFILLMLVVALFIAKLSRDSKQFKAMEESPHTDEIDEFLSEVNKAFFGFAVSAKNQTTYWLGFAIYLITLIYSIYNTLVQLFY
jgi:hypothetical protein